MVVKSWLPKFQLASKVSTKTELAAEMVTIMGDLHHTDIQRMIFALGESKIIDLDKSLRELLTPIASSLPTGSGATPNFHIICCNEYAVVTKVSDSRISELSGAGVRGALT
jgi:hypothetical protein